MTYLLTVLMAGAKAFQIVEQFGQQGAAIVADLTLELLISDVQSIVGLDCHQRREISPN